MRYLQQLCAELNTGLLLAHAPSTERGVLTEQFLFTQLDLTHTSAVRRPARVTDNRRVGHAKNRWPANTAKYRWLLENRNLPAGFRKVMEMVRSLAGGRNR